MQILDTYDTQTVNPPSKHSYLAQSPPPFDIHLSPGEYVF